MSVAYTSSRALARRGNDWTPLPPGTSFSEEVIERGEALDTPRRGDRSRVQVPEDLPAAHAGIPLLIAGAVSGSLTFIRPGDAPDFDANARIFAEAIGAQAALAFELDRARKGREQMMLLSDRDRIARDLHDHVIQQLFATGLDCSHRLCGQGGDDRERISRSIDVLDDTIREIRNTIFSLSQPIGGGQALRVELSQIVEGSSVVLGFSPTLEIIGLTDEGLPISSFHTCSRVPAKRSPMLVVTPTPNRYLSVSTWTSRRCTSKLSTTASGLIAERSSGLKNLRERASLFQGSLTLSNMPKAVPVLTGWLHFHKSDSRPTR